MVERRDAPLFAWGDALRAARARRRQLRRRGGMLLVGIALLGATIAAPPRPRLVWNASASAPLGLYLVAPGTPPHRGDMVAAWPPAAVRALAAARHYLPRRVPLVKRVAGVAGDRVCARGPVVTIDGRVAVVRRAADAAGRPLPAWRGCVRLGAGDIFLLMAGTPDSFDGRYFGPTRAADVIGRATPLWLR
jgi:conjugative transfer signal peptidase TraF